MSGVPCRLTEAVVLDLWERGLAEVPAARRLLLAAAAAPTGQGAADLPLGTLNSLLLELRCAAFGDALPCAADCPACGESLDVTVTAAELLPPPSGGADDTDAAAEPTTGSLTALGATVTFRAITARDAAAVDPASPGARQTLLRRCVVDVSPPADLPDEVLEEVARRLADLDPGADPLLLLDCPFCHHRWTASLDVAEHLWTDVSGCARRILHEVHALARAYGWSEADVLSVSPVRRRFYLEVSAG
ncbi:MULTISPECIES: hypothetical protein [unclassified Streptomyces]|uniref:hypothetical protein n=1 Tax=unclassified Streptomyces TaxID=2593676 RepID=UPI003D72570E